MKRIVFILNLLFAAIIVMAQVPAGFSYQAVVRNTSGDIVASKNVKFKFSIIRNTETGTSVYVETQSTTTNSFGLANLKVGMGTKVIGDFDPAAWGDNPHFLKVELDPAGGSTFTELGITQLLAVPYAFHAQTVEDDSWGTQTTVTNETLEGNGTTSSPLKIARQSAASGQVLKWNGTLWAPAGDEAGGLTLPWSGTTNNTGQALRINNSGSGMAIIGESVTGNGVLGQTDGINTSGIFGLAHSLSGVSYGVRGENDSPDGYSGYFLGSKFFISGNTGIGVSEPTAKLDIDGQLKIRGGCPAEGKVLTSDASGLAYWQNPSVGGLTLPYSGSGELASDPIFTITNTGNGSGIKGRSDATSGVSYGVIGESASQNGTGVYGSAPHIGVEAHAHASDGTAVWGYAYDSEGQNYGIKGITNSSTGYSGYFHGGRFYISGNTGIGVTDPTAKLEVAGQVKITGGSPGEGKVLTSDADGLASWETLSGGGFTLPYNGTVTSSDKAFSITNNGTGSGITGITTSSTMGGVVGFASSNNGANYGVLGQSNSTNGRGVFGWAPATTGLNYGIQGKSNSNEGVGVEGIVTATSGTTIAVRGETNSLTGYSGYFTGGKFYVNGNVGIGNNSPANALSVSGQADISGGLVVGGTTLAGKLLVANADGAGHSFKVGSSAGDNANIYFLTDGLIFDCYRPSDGRRQPILLQPIGGRVGIGTKTPTQVLHVVGDAYKTLGGTSWATSSDLRLKTLLGNYDKGLKEIVALQPVSFIYNEGNPRQLSSDTEQVGFVAQEVQKVFPEAVSEANDGYLDFNIHAINIALVNAVKELKIENERLKAENSQIVSRLDKLENLISVYAERK